MTWCTSKCVISNLLCENCLEFDILFRAGLTQHKEMQYSCAYHNEFWRWEAVFLLLDLSSTETTVVTTPILLGLKGTQKHGEEQGKKCTKAQEIHLLLIRSVIVSVIKTNSACVFCIQRHNIDLQLPQYFSSIYNADMKVFSWSNSFVTRASIDFKSL